MPFIIPDIQEKKFTVDYVMKKLGTLKITFLQSLNLDGSRPSGWVRFLFFTFFCTVQKGVGANMLKVGSKRRRTKGQIAAEKEEALLKEAATAEKLAKLE